MGKGINVKVPTASVIKALEARLESNELDKKHNEKAEKAYPAILEKWEAEMIKKAIKFKPTGISYSSWNKRIEVNYELPTGFKWEQPEKDYRNTLSDWQIKEIESALRMLKMTEEEYVTASTMKSISEYL